MDELPELIRRLNRGLPYTAIAFLATESGLSVDAIVSFIDIPPRALPRRIATGQLTPRESERLYRLALISDHAKKLFEGDALAARQWLFKPNAALGNVSPLSFAKSEIGAREVEDLIGRLENGVFS